PYTIKNGDTFFEIAKEQGVESSLIKAANDNPTKLKKGHILYIPRRGKELTQVLSSNATIDELRDYYGNKLNTIYTAQHCPNLNDDKVNIGIILPFQLHKEDPPRQALLYTDFYKGFLLAVDSIGKKSKKPVNINVWDTQHNLNVTDSLLALDEMKNLDVLFAPGEPKQLQRVNKFGETNHIDVINCFTGKNNDYETNPYVFQVNTPNSMLSSIVSDWVGKKFNEYTIVYLDDPDLRDTDFYPAFKEQIEALGMKHKTLTIIHDLEYEKLSKYMDPGMNYLFVPTTSSKTMMAKTIKAIKTAKNERFDCEIALLGYPEYLLMTKDYGESFSAIDTYIFSKFYNNDAKRTRNIENLFVKQYGETMINTMPSMALLGFDMGMYVINALSNGQSLGKANSVHDGIQTSLNFERVNNWGGFINRFVKIVHMTPSGIKVSTLK
ncbi:MAG: LysM peptidoglycan-binding domain-containing protein, partial [Muribaculaceae bacterium]|nr:LysM peptidoglycan-binding domain-containing protein [Muribaculaceae bacterium]